MNYRGLWNIIAERQKGGRNLPLTMGSTPTSRWNYGIVPEPSINYKANTIHRSFHNTEMAMADDIVEL